jgi:hypothetical protein
MAIPLELVQRLLPAIEERLSERGPRVPHVALEQSAQFVGGSCDSARNDQVLVQAQGEHALRIVDEDVPAAHPRAEVAPEPPEDDDGAVRHVLARLLTDAFDDRHGARVAHAEALSGATGAEQLTARGAVESRVPEENRVARVAGRRPDHEAASAHCLPDVVVGLADEIEPDARREEGAEALSCGAVKTRPDPARRRPRAERQRDRASKRCPDGAIVGADR